MPNNTLGNTYLIWKVVCFRFYDVYVHMTTVYLVKSLYIRDNKFYASGLVRPHYYNTPRTPKQ